MMKAGVPVFLLTVVIFGLLVVVPVWWCTIVYSPEFIAALTGADFKRIPAHIVIVTHIIFFLPVMGLYYFGILLLLIRLKLKRA